MLELDCYFQISTFCDIKTRIKLKLTCKTLCTRIPIELLQDETVLDKEFISNPDNCWLFFEYFNRKFLIPNSFNAIEPYLIHYDRKPRKVLYASSCYSVFYQQEIESKQESFRSSSVPREIKYFKEIKEDWYDSEEDDSDCDDPIIAAYTAKELWYNILGQAFDYSNPNCVGYKLNPDSKRIKNFEYVGTDFFGGDFGKDCISFEY